MGWGTRGIARVACVPLVTSRPFNFASPAVVEHRGDIDQDVIGLASLIIVLCCRIERWHFGMPCAERRRALCAGCRFTPATFFFWLLVDGSLVVARHCVALAPMASTSSHILPVSSRYTPAWVFLKAGLLTPIIKFLPATSSWKSMWPDFVQDSCLLEFPSVPRSEEVFGLKYSALFLRQREGFVRMMMLIM